MALKQCRECGREISTDAKSCPHCGASNPTRSKVTAGQGCLGCLGVIVVLAVIGALANAFDSGTSGIGGAVATVRANPDSVWAAGQVARLDSLTSSDSMRYDHAFHTSRLSAPHSEPFHRRVVSIRIAEARAAANSASTRPAALAHLAAADSPYTSSQASAIASLRKSISTRIEADERRAQIPIRQAYASTLRTKFLDEGFDIKMTTAGNEATTLKFEFVLFNDVWSHKLVTGEFLATLRTMGFTRFRMTDGYDWGYYWDI